MERKKVATAGAGALLVGAAITEFTVADFMGLTKLGEVGPWALLIAETAFIVYGLFKGWIVPKPYYDSALERATAAEDANERLSERAAKLTDTNSVQARTIEKNSAAADTTIKVMSALQDARSAAIGGTE
jgi:hypothetical protein